MDNKWPDNAGLLTKPACTQGSTLSNTALDFLNTLLIRDADSTQFREKFLPQALSLSDFYKTELRRPLPEMEFSMMMTSFTDDRPILMRTMALTFVI